MSSWNCEQCTFANSEYLDSCEICGHQRPNTPKKHNIYERDLQYAQELSAMYEEIDNISTTHPTNEFENNSNSNTNSNSTPSIIENNSNSINTPHTPTPNEVSTQQIPANNNNHNNQVDEKEEKKKKESFIESEPKELFKAIQKIKVLKKNKPSLKITANILRNKLYATKGGWKAVFRTFGRTGNSYFTTWILSSPCVKNSDNELVLTGVEVVIPPQSSEEIKFIKEAETLILNNKMKYKTVENTLFKTQNRTWTTVKCAIWGENCDYSLHDFYELYYPIRFQSVIEEGYDYWIICEKKTSKKPKKPKKHKKHKNKKYSPRSIIPNPQIISIGDSVLLNKSDTIHHCTAPDDQIGQKATPCIIAVHPTRAGVYATGGPPGVVKIWKLDGSGSTACIANFGIHNTDVVAMCYNANGNLLASADASAHCFIWSKTGDQINTRFGWPGEEFTEKYSSQRHLVLTCNGNTIGPAQISFLGDDKLIVAEFMTVSIWNIKTCKQLLECQLLGDNNELQYILGFELDPSGSLLAIRGDKSYYIKQILYKESNENKIKFDNFCDLTNLRWADSSKIKQPNIRPHWTPDGLFVVCAGGIIKNKGKSNALRICHRSNFKNKVTSFIVEDVIQSFAVSPTCYAIAKREIDANSICSKYSLNNTYLIAAVSGNKLCLYDFALEDHLQFAFQDSHVFFKEVNWATNGKELYLVTFNSEIYTIKFEYKSK